MTSAQLKTMPLGLNICNSLDLQLGIPAGLIQPSSS